MRHEQGAKRPHRVRRGMAGAALVLFLAALAFASSSAAVSMPAAGAGAGAGARVADSGPQQHHDVSAPLRSLAPSGAPGRAHPALRGFSGPSGAARTAAPDTSGARGSTRLAPAPAANFDGIPADGVAPPDNEGAAGSTQYVEWYWSSGVVRCAIRVASGLNVRV